MSSDLNPSRAPSTPDNWSAWGKAWSDRFPKIGPSIQGAKAITSLANAAVPFSTATHILDIGCGTGDLLSSIITSHSPLPASCKLTASDLSPGMLAQTTARGEKEGWENVEYKILDANNLESIESDSVSHVLSSFTLHFLGATAQSEAYRILAPSGVFASTYMTKAPWTDILRPLSVVRPEKQIPSGPEAFGNPGVVQGIIEKAGFKDYEEKEIDVWCEFEEGAGGAEELVDFVIGSMPFLDPITGDLTVGERREWRALCVEKVRRDHRDGVLRGKAIVATGRK